MKRRWKRERENSNSKTLFYKEREKKNTDRQTDRQTDGRTDRHRDRQTETDRQRQRDVYNKGKKGSMHYSIS